MNEFEKQVAIQIVAKIDSAKCTNCSSSYLETIEKEIVSALIQAEELGRMKIVSTIMEYIENHTDMGDYSVPCHEVLNLLTSPKPIKTSLKLQESPNDFSKI